MRRMILTALAATTLLGCQRQMTRHQRGVEEQVLTERTAAWARFMNNQATDSLGSIFINTPDLLAVWPDGQRARGWEEQQDALHTLFGGVATLNLVVQDPTVRVLDWGSALVTFRYSMDQLTRDAMRDVYSGHGMQLWIRSPEDTDWRVAAMQLSRTPVGETAQRVRS